MKKMKAVAWEIITTETATEIKEGQKSLPSFFLFINSVLYAPLGSEIISSVPLLNIGI
jgi:hypothetical protein